MYKPITYIRFSFYFLILSQLIFSLLGIKSASDIASLALIQPLDQKLGEFSAPKGEDTHNYLSTTAVFQWPTTGTIGSFIYVSNNGGHYGVDILAPSTAS